MGKWACHCGYPMDNHSAPDPNAYSVYSDELWEEIMEKADKDNKIDYYDFSDASYYVWRCPNCHGLMVFGEDTMRYTFYQKIVLDSDELEKPDSTYDKIYRVAKVTFSEFGDEYTYICEDESIEEEHYVVVPVGSDNVERIAYVTKVFLASEHDSDYPVDKLKHVIKRYTEFDKDKAEEIPSDFVATG